MPEEKETAATATTMWQDRHSGKRGHELMTRKLADTIPALYANEKVTEYDTVLAPAKLFSPYSQWTWYITEMDPATGTCFGLVDGLEQEIGYFDLTELAETTVFGGVPAVERDLYWEPKTLGEIKRWSQGDSPHGDDSGKADTMIDANETEEHAPDVVSAEEFLFGGVTEETADDAPAAVAGEVLAGDATDDAGDVETAEEPDDADDAGEQPAPAETESSQELKVVLSIKGGRAIIGVQQPSADPHIEAFDGLDLDGLAREVSGVAGRAKAKWEEEPRHPAHVKPAPPARRQRRREQAPVETAAEEGEAEQQQPETLRLF